MATTTRWTIVNGMVLEETLDGVTSLLLPDPQGNVVAKINSSQNVVNKTWFWPYGEVRTGTPGTTLAYGGAWGYYTDTPYGSTRIYVRARYLQQNYGRWLTVDPLWPEQKAYSYGDDAPLTKADPSGMFPVACAVACAGAAICIADLIAACRDWSGFKSFQECAWETFKHLPPVLRAACGIGLGGCLLCVGKQLVKPGPKPVPSPKPRPNPLPAPPKCPPPIWDCAAATAMAISMCARGPDCFNCIPFHCTTFGLAISQGCANTCTLAGIAWCRGRG